MKDRFFQLWLRLRRSLAGRLYELILPGGDRPAVRLDPRRSAATGPRSKRVFFDVQDHCYVEAFWKVLGGSAFTGASLYVFDYEVLRFDCSGPGTGHYHLFPLERTGLGRRGRKRLWLPESSAEQQIERAVFELSRNALYYLQRSRYRDIRHFDLDEGRLAEAASRVWVQCRAFLADASGEGRTPVKYQEARSAS